MSVSLALVLAGVMYLVWAGILFVRWQTTRTLQTEVFPQYQKDGTLKPTVREEEFAEVFMRCEGPRFGFYLFTGAVAAPLIIMASLALFNFIWRIVWQATGELGWFEVGELPHSLMVVFMYVGVLAATAWITMLQYHKRAPMSLKREIRRLNGEDF